MSSCSAFNLEPSSGPYNASSFMPTCGRASIGWIVKLFLCAVILTGVYGCASGTGAGTTKPLSSQPETTPSYELIQDLSPAGLETPAFKTDPLILWGPPPAGPVRLSPPRTSDLVHQVIHVSFDWSRKAVLGSTTLTFTGLEEPLAAISLDAVGMSIISVKHGDDVLRHSYDKQTLRITLPSVLMPHDTISLTVNYEAVRPRKGLYFIDRKQVIWTQGEMIETRHWVPTIDRPDEQTTWEMFITVPKSQKALSNGRLVSVRDHGDNQVWHWRQELPASTYHFSIVAGDYTIVQDKPWYDVPISYWTYPDSVEAAKRGFARTRDMISVFSRLTGVRYPWAKYDQIAVPDFIFGGMENVSASTQNDRTVLIPASEASIRDAQALVSHEIAHQWFGNIVALGDWSEAWLNEGFAAFLETVFWEEDGQHTRAALNRVNDQKLAINADTRGRRPLVYNRWDKDPLELFLSGHIYPKGAAVLDMLRQTVGKDVFWKAINIYLTENAYKTVTTQKLQEAFEKASGQSLHYFFEQWVYKAGLPALQIAHRYDETTRQSIFTIIQVQHQDSLTGLFTMDVDVDVVTDSGLVRGTAFIRGETTLLTIPVKSPPRAIRWDPENRWLSVVDFPRSRNMLLYQLQRGDILARREAIELLKPYVTDDANVKGVFQRVADGDTSYEIRQMALNALKAVH